ncbi:class I SAM-dependent methyltransferase [Eleftheria terrae]|uniref:class I SAM-dependent methyltransferase n=1 Tax=Eleftheria terrae TaxID=1597781 RepID=UPI00263B3EDA|nr:class I SAM-dependent methyltransferase [Eleftheria terrae]WKB56202.1 class I SAM-dependent methyltransferase [Eleftheria terrae]
MNEEYAVWLDNIGDEIAYWEHYLRTRGGDYPDDFRFRLNPDTEVGSRDTRLARRLSLLAPVDIFLLDVGSGPLTNLGKNVPGKRLHITACDPLADVYNTLIDRFDIHPPVRTTFSDGENLSHFFPPRRFDAVHCANALDHSYDPLSAIVEMLKIVKPGGFIQLGHFENEAVSENYHGLHQWNFTERNGDFVIWNQKSDISLTQFFGEAAFVDTERTPSEPKNWIVVTIRRNELTDGFLQERSSTLPQKYQTSLFRHFEKHLGTA